MKIFLKVFILLIVMLVIGYVFLEQRVEKAVVVKKETILKCPFTPYNFSASYLHPCHVEEFSPAIEISQANKTYNKFRFWGVSKLMNYHNANFTLAKIFRHENYCAAKGCYHVIEGQAKFPIPKLMNKKKHFVGYFVEPLFLNMRLNTGFLPSVTVMPFKEMNDVLVNFVITFSSDLKDVFINQQLNFFRSLHETDTNFRLIITEFNPVDNSIESAMKNTSIAFRYSSLNQTFSRVKGLNTGGAAVTEEKEILFFLDVDMKFSSRFPTTIRNRVIQGAQVYFPVCFAEDGAGGGTNLVTGLGNVGMYKSDFAKLPWKKANDTVWGGEDDRLLARVKDKGFQFYRNIEPDFIHVYHPVRSWKILKVDFYNNTIIIFY